MNLQVQRRSARFISVIKWTRFRVQGSGFRVQGSGFRVNKEVSLCRSKALQAKSSFSRHIKSVEMVQVCVRESVREGARGRERERERESA